jgi:hypothetical protein
MIGPEMEDRRKAYRRSAAGSIGTLIVRTREIIRTLLSCASFYFFVRSKLDA